MEEPDAQSGRFCDANVVQEYPMADPTAEQIQQRAYELWHAAGRPEDREQEFWYEAERQLKKSDGTINPDEKSNTFLE